MYNDSILYIIYIHMEILSHYFDILWMVAKSCTSWKRWFIPLQFYDFTVFHRHLIVPNWRRISSIHRTINCFDDLRLVSCEHSLKSRFMRIMVGGWYRLMVFDKIIQTRLHKPHSPQDLQGPASGVIATCRSPKIARHMLQRGIHGYATVVYIAGTHVIPFVHITKVDTGSSMSGYLSDEKSTKKKDTHQANRQIIVYYCYIIVRIGAT